MIKTEDGFYFHTDDRERVARVRDELDALKLELRAFMREHWPELSPWDYLGPLDTPSDYRSLQGVLSCVDHASGQLFNAADRMARRDYAEGESRMPK